MNCGSGDEPVRCRRRLRTSGVPRVPTWFRRPGQPGRARTWHRGGSVHCLRDSSVDAWVPARAHDVGSPGCATHSTASMSRVVHGVSCDDHSSPIVPSPACRQQGSMLAPRSCAHHRVAPGRASNARVQRHPVGFRMRPGVELVVRVDSPIDLRYHLAALSGPSPARFPWRIQAHEARSAFSSGNCLQLPALRCTHHPALAYRARCEARGKASPSARPRRREAPAVESRRN